MLRKLFFLLAGRKTPLKAYNMVTFQTEKTIDIYGNEGQMLI